MSNGFDTSDSWDELYGGSDFNNSNPFQGYFNQWMGTGVDVFDPGSILEKLSETYDVTGLQESMFPALPKELVKGAMPSSYQGFADIQRNPLERKYKKDIEQTAGVLNPNIQRRRARNLYKAGAQDIKRGIFDRTSLASEAITNWMNSALKKVFNMKW